MEKKLEHLPLTRIENTFVNIDVSKQVYIKAGQPQHTIPFTDMIYKGTHYEMPWDLFTERKALAHELGSEDVVMAKIPLLTQSAPAEMAEKYNISILEIKNRTDFDLAVDLETYNNRRNGILPEIEMWDKKTYKVDLANNQLSHQERSYKISDFSPDFNAEGSRSAYIDKLTGNFVHIDLFKIIEMPPEHIIKVILPGVNKLDPYYEATRQNKDVRTYLMQNPPVMKSSVKILELKDTGLSKQVKHNQEREAQKASLAHERQVHRKIRNKIH